VAAEIGEDYPVSRVPPAARYHWFSIATNRFGQLSALSQFLLGSALGFSMTFWGAFWALTLGAVLLELVSIAVGIAAQREGMTTSLFARWAGFGSYGSSLVGLVIAISLIGWFGVQNAVFAQGIQQILGILPLWVWSIITGAIVIAIVAWGILSMTWTAYIAVPLFLALVAWSLTVGLSHYSFAHLLAMMPPGPVMSLSAGTTLVAGGFIVGAVITPDLCRFNKGPWDVVKQTVLGITLGEWTVALAGVLLAHAVRSSNVITIVMSTSGVVGVVLLVMATLKINDWNLYSSTLGLDNLIDAVFGRKVSRRATTWVVGALGVILSAAGILTQFENFLDILGVAIPPIAAIMVVDYWLLRRSRAVLDETRDQGELPSRSETWNWPMIIAWVAAFLIGYFVHWGIQSVNSLVSAGIIYWVLGTVIPSMKTSTPVRVAGKS